MNSLKLSLAALALVSLGGCAMHQRHHAGGAGMPGHATMDMNAHCDKHRQMMAGKSAAERKAMMDGHMASMTPEMHRQMMDMHQKCQ